MIYYVAHAYSSDKHNICNAKKTLTELQEKDLSNCYICPIVSIPIFENANIKKEDKYELCFDLMTACDAVVIGSYISKDVKKEIEFARLIKMEVFRIDENGELQPFTE